MTVADRAVGRVLTVGVTLALVLAAVACLAAAALLTLFGEAGELRTSLFAAGLACWLVGIAWGVVVNGAPLRGAA